MKRTSGRRINPDSLYTLWFTVILICTLGLTSFMVSFNGLHDVAGWVGLPVWLRWAVPIFIDIAILAYSLAAVIHRARGETVWPTWTTLGAFTLLSVIANGVHALTRGAGTTAVQSWIGAGIAGMAPVAVFAATEQLSRLAFATAREEPKTIEPESAEPAGDVTPAFDSDSEHTPEPGETTSELDEEPTAEPLVGDAPEPRHPSEASEEPVSESEGVFAPALTQPSPGLSSRETTVAVSQRPASEPVEVAVAADEATSPETDDADTESGSEATAVIDEQESTERDDDRPRLGNEVTAGQSEEERLIAWVAERRKSDEPVTGVAVGEFLGRSARTGRNRLKALQELRPDLFEGAE
ncbi:DUF2637 domain-containing protein [uncultured Kocuria sp.]|uniref:DUF2637 domain-containing protein n=1 Tax=uncultured Kocuria sp. TaxID=259305 RepID=UPI00259AB9D0|nr:DUF2637 domain-containing protein [uncultured Kocuria sp.]